jgi:HEAT repeat protein
VNQIQRQVSDLRSLATRKPTLEGFAKAAAALDSRFEGVQSVALRVLGEWGGAESISVLREFLGRAFLRKYGWSIRGVAVNALARHLRPDDADWVLDLYFELPNVLSKHEVLPLVVKLPPAVARERLKKELRNSNWMDRQAAVKAIGNMPFSDRNQLICPLLNDSNDNVRASARALSGQSDARI